VACFFVTYNDVEIKLVVLIELGPSLLQHVFVLCANSKNEGGVERGVAALTHRNSGEWAGLAEATAAHSSDAKCGAMGANMSSCSASARSNCADTPIRCLGVRRTLLVSPCTLVTTERSCCVPLTTPIHTQFSTRLAILVAFIVFDKGCQLDKVNTKIEVIL
jgi:hypothetical protein